MSRSPHPYRVAAHPAPRSWSERLDPLAEALRLVRCFVIGWAFLRVAVCTVRGIDFEGVVALLVLVATVATLTRSLA